MKITLDLSKSIEENASAYFEAAKKSKKKAEGAKKALSMTKKKLEKIEDTIKKREEEEKRKKDIPERKKQWYEKFRWFITSEGFLVIGGRDATTNEIIIKKHTDKEDLVFHTELPGSPFVVLKTEGKKPGQESIEESAQFTGIYSKAWPAGRTTLEVFYVNPDQVSKEAPSGEYIGKGSFMIYGKKNILNPIISLSIGIMEDRTMMAGPKKAVEKHCRKHVELVQGNEKISSVAKKVKIKLEADDLDEIVRLIPQGSRLNA